MLLKSRLLADPPLWFELPWQTLLPGVSQSLQYTLQWAHTDQAEDGLPMGYGYVHFSTPTELSRSICTALEHEWLQRTGESAQVSRLVGQMKLAGASAQAHPHHHYVVETDPEPGWADEIYRWYNEEHLPGLSRVPGCVWAHRLLNADHQPESFACYDLTSAEVMGCAPWLAVRASSWSDRCRPHFTNTMRTRFFNTTTRSQP